MIVKLQGDNRINRRDNLPTNLFYSIIIDHNNISITTSRVNILYRNTVYMYTVYELQISKPFNTFSISKIKSTNRPRPSPHKIASVKPIRMSFWGARGDIYFDWYIPNY